MISYIHMHMQHSYVLCTLHSTHQRSLVCMCIGPKPSLQSQTPQEGAPRLWRPIPRGPWTGPGPNLLYHPLLMEPQAAHLPSSQSSSSGQAKQPAACKPGRESSRKVDKSSYTQPTPPSGPGAPAPLPLPQLSTARPEAALTGGAGSSSLQPPGRRSSSSGKGKRGHR